MTNSNKIDQIRSVSQIYISQWHGVEPPNDLAIDLLEEHLFLINAFEKLRGQLQIADEPAIFEGALIKCAAFEVKEL